MLYAVYPFYGQICNVVTYDVISNYHTRSRYDITSYEIFHGVERKKFVASAVTKFDNSANL